ncbi:ribosomal protein S18-alanine N-acetyltransferase [Vagococcus martis]|nr:ribosomal protein S18-alanine N-acetyltransferase [Vagococcus martis]
MIEKKLEFQLAKVTDIMAFQQVLKHVYGGESPWSTAILWMELSKKKYGRYIKACLDHQLVGFGGIRIECDDAHITNIAVLPEYQSQGIGTSLLNELKEEAKNLSCHSMSLEVRASNQQAISVYQSFGFEQVGIKEGYYLSSREDAIEMRLKF